jgi:predicted PurR-regulated permease PerM
MRHGAQMYPPFRRPQANFRPDRPYPQSVTPMDASQTQTSRDDRIERAVSAVLLLLLAVGCLVILRPFLSALLWALIISSSTWPVCARLEGMLGGRRSAAAAVMVMGAAALFLLPLAAVASHLVSDVRKRRPS